VLNRYVLRAGSMVQGGNFVLRREALEQIGGFNTAISFYGEDTDIARRMNRVGQGEVHVRPEDVLVGAAAEAGGDADDRGRYTINYLWTTFRKKPFTEEYIDIREQ
jgi:hypothetical protein